MSKEKLDTMEKKLSQRKEEVAEVRGEKKTLMKQLADEGCKTVTQATKEADLEDSKAAEMQESFDQKVNELETEFEW